MQTESKGGVTPPADLRNQDGLWHINVWSKAKTELGQLLSNFAHTPFRHPKYGSFASMEAMWYWLATGCKHDHLRRLYSASAKSAGSKLPVVEMPVEEFREAICSGIRCKIESHPRLKEMFLQSVLPFRHYYVYGRNNDVIVEKAKHNWQMEFLEELRDEFRKERGLEPASKARSHKHEPVHKNEPKPNNDNGWVESTDGETQFADRAL